MSFLALLSYTIVLFIFLRLFCCRIDISADNNSLFYSKTRCGKANSTFPQQHSPPLKKIRCLGDPGAKNVCNEAYVTGFLKSTLEKRWADIPPGIISCGYLEEFLKASWPLHRRRRTPLRMIFICFCFLVLVVNKTVCFVLSVKSYDHFFVSQYLCVIL